jgi:hypothetical protein
MFEIKKTDVRESAREDERIPFVEVNQSGGNFRGVVKEENHSGRDDRAGWEGSPRSRAAGRLTGEVSPAPSSPSTML